MVGLRQGVRPHPRELLPGRPPLDRARPDEDDSEESPGRQWWVDRPTYVLSPEDDLVHRGGACDRSRPLKGVWDPDASGDVSVVRRTERALRRHSSGVLGVDLRPVRPRGRVDGPVRLEEVRRPVSR